MARRNQEKQQDWRKKCGENICYQIFISMVTYLPYPTRGATDLRLKISGRSNTTFSFYKNLKTILKKKHISIDSSRVGEVVDKVAPRKLTDTSPIAKFRRITVKMDLVISIYTRKEFNI